MHLPPGIVKYAARPGCSYMFPRPGARVQARTCERNNTSHSFHRRERRNEPARLLRQQRRRPRASSTPAFCLARPHLQRARLSRPCACVRTFFFLNSSVTGACSCAKSLRRVHAAGAAEQHASTHASVRAHVRLHAGSLRLCASKVLESLHFSRAQMHIACAHDATALRPAPPAPGALIRL